MYTYTYTHIRIHRIVKWGGGEGVASEISCRTASGLLMEANHVSLYALFSSLAPISLSLFLSLSLCIPLKLTH